MVLLHMQRKSPAVISSSLYRIRLLNLILDTLRVVQEYLSSCLMRYTLLLLPAQADSLQSWNVLTFSASSVLFSFQWIIIFLTMFSYLWYVSFTLLHLRFDANTLMSLRQRGTPSLVVSILITVWHYYLNKRWKNKTVAKIKFFVPGTKI